MNELLKYGDLLVDCSLEKYNTYRLKTKAHYILFIKDIDALKEFLKLKKEFILLGNGSNVVLSDNYYDGIILKLDKLNKIEYLDNNIVKVGSGVMIPKLALDVINHKLSGLEWAYGIPGTMGGVIFNNAGAYNEEIFSFVKDVTYMDLDGNLYTKDIKELNYGYRTSYFKDNPQYIILEITLNLKDYNSGSMDIIKDRLERRKNSQPLNYPSCGSVFRNSTLPAGKLIEDAGLKGVSIGGASVSQKHANFIINNGNASSEDIKKLISLVHDKVLDMYNIDLIREVEYKEW